MSLTAQERERVRYHLGYLSVSPASSLTFGLPKPIQPLYLVETAMDYLMDVAEGRIRRILTTLDAIECELERAVPLLATSQLEGVTLREDHCDALESEYRRWGGRLADLLGVPFYGYSNRYRGGGSGAAGNIPVRG